MSRGRMPGAVLFLFAIDVALGAAYLLDYAAGHPFAKLAAFVDLDQEGNLPTWYASIKWFCVAAMLGLFALRNVRAADAKSWPLLLLPLVFLAFSVDETAQVHEWVARRSDAYLPNASREGTLFARTGIWMFVVGVPFIAFFLWLVRSVRTYFRNVPGALVKMCAGVAIMLTGALGLEALVNFAAPNSGLAVLEILSEEMCEMLGATVVFWGSYELLQRHGLALRFEPVAPRSAA